jgi:hypothetical protein
MYGVSAGHGRTWSAGSQKYNLGNVRINFVLLVSLIFLRASPFVAPLCQVRHSAIVMVLWVQNETRACCGYQLAAEETLLFKLFERLAVRRSDRIVGCRGMVPLTGKAKWHFDEQQ